jgi:histidyl-tRNA synthetase
MKKAASMKARWAVIVGGDELKDQKVTLKDLDSGHQEQIAKTQLIQRLI